MRDKLQPLGLFIVAVGGVPFGVRRRSTELMLGIGDARRVFGLLAGAARTAVNPEATKADRAEAVDSYAKASTEYVAMQKRAYPLIVATIDGEEVTEDNRPPWDEVAAVFDPIFERFLESGLSADPTPDSCPAPQESRPRSG